MLGFLHHRGCTVTVGVYLCGYHSVSQDKVWRPVEMMTVFVSLYQRVRAKLEKMASIFEPKFSDDSLERVEVFKAQAFCAFAIIVRGCPWIPSSRSIRHA
jgi:hypothetical protein